MDHNTTTPKYFQSPFFGSNVELGKTKDSPFAVADGFQDPLCKLNLKETSEFVRSFPTAQRRNGVNSVVSQRKLMEAPTTPGRPVFNYSFSHNVARKNFPSKWDDAEKWLSCSSCNESPVHGVKTSASAEACNALKTKHIDVFSEKLRVSEDKDLKFGSSFQVGGFNGGSVPQDVVLKDRFTDEVESVLPNLRYSEPSKEGFLFRNSATETMKDAGTGIIHELKHRDIGTEMTPLGSSKTSRCHTPLKSSSPARHNTPADRSGPLPLGNSSSTNSTIDIEQLNECHLAKLQLGSQYDSVTSNWSSREEEEEEISKSLRHFETGVTSRKSVSDSRAAAWEEEEKTKCCLRYQREEAQIQAWLNLQTAKAEAQSKKLEVKIQKMRSNLEEKLMKRMAMVQRKAEEWRAAARHQHTEQIQKATQQSKKIINRHNNLQFSGHVGCGCLPCNTYPY
ncbi:uncharacterized protein LOC126680884 [Mercurialis annua]|uniref:uncharacterized protein LOC126680884 n=1 Tax=Mercurialis annua TaxID=3986 RepID=UPI00215E27BA|nr:uncharacterized protein LOC126680884 [Mercurialis annua]